MNPSILSLPTRFRKKALIFPATCDSSSQILLPSTPPPATGNKTKKAVSAPTSPYSRKRINVDFGCSQADNCRKNAGLDHQASNLEMKPDIDHNNGVTSKIAVIIPPNDDDIEIKSEIEATPVPRNDREVDTGHGCNNESEYTIEENSGSDCESIGVEDTESEVLSKVIQKPTTEEFSSDLGSRISERSSEEGEANNQPIDLPYGQSSIETATSIGNGKALSGRKMMVSDSQGTRRLRQISSEKYKRRSRAARSNKKSPMCIKARQWDRLEDIREQWDKCLKSMDGNLDSIEIMFPTLLDTLENMEREIFFSVAGDLACEKFRNNST